MRTVRSYFYGLLLPYILQGARLLQEKLHIPSNIISQQSTILTIYLYIFQLYNYQDYPLRYVNIPVDS